MHIKNHPPVFVPYEFQVEMERLTKAALMDLVWDLVTPTIESGSPDDIMSEIRNRAAFVLTYREQQ